MPARLDSINAITLLGFIEEAPRSGYDLKRAIDDRLEGLLEITSGTIYYTLKRLEAKGWIRGSTSRSAALSLCGPMPSCASSKRSWPRWRG